MKVLFVRPNRDTFGFKPISISILSAIAKKQKWEVKLFDTTNIDLGEFGYDSRKVADASKLFKPVDFSQYNLKKEKIDLKEKIIQDIIDFNPDLVSISVLSDQYLISDKITKSIKEKFPQLPIIWGGAYATLNPEKVLDIHKADFVCVGEGIEAFSEVLQKLEKNDSLDKIQNIWTKKNGVIIKNKVRPLKENLDDLPYLDWSIYDKNQFLKPFDGKVLIGGDHMITWGCPNHCTYCINHFYYTLYDKKYPIRGYSVKRIIEELKFLKNKYQIEFYKFNDENFLLRPLDNFRELSEMYSREVNLPFAMMCNAKSATPEKVELLKKMNCVSISFGLECGDFELRKTLLNRIDSKDDIIKCVAMFNRAGIRTSSFNMLALPFYSRDTYMKTVELNKEANIQYPNAVFFYPYEGTKLREISIKEGFFDPNDINTSEYRDERPSLHFKNLTEQELIEMHKVFVLYIKLPKDYEPFIKRSEILDETGIKLREKLNEIYDATVMKNDGWYNDEDNRSQYLNTLEKNLRNGLDNPKLVKK